MAVTTKLTCSATEAYVWTSWISFATGWISIDVLGERLRFVLDESEDTVARNWAQLLANELEVLGDEDAWKAESASDAGQFSTTVELANSEPDDFLLQLIVNVPGSGKWDFHQYDADPLPSVPHGHEQGGKKKLDAYLGFIYLNAVQVSRASRVGIVGLWNDEQFRAFAYRAIAWHMAEFPLRGWRVSNPLRLPRRR